MSYNQNCYYALYTDTSEKAYSAETPKYKFWDSDFTFGIEFYKLQNSNEMCLFRQEQSIEIGYESSCFYVNVCGAKKTVSYAAMQPIPKVWNTLVVTFNKEESLLTGYINGAKGFEEDIS